MCQSVEEMQGSEYAARVGFCSGLPVAKGRATLDVGIGSDSRFVNGLSSQLATPVAKDQTHVRNKASDGEEPLNVNAHIGAIPAIVSGCSVQKIINRSSQLSISA